MKLGNRFNVVLLLFLVSILAILPVVSACSSSQPAPAQKPAGDAKPAAAPAKQIEWRMQSLYPAADLSTSVQAQGVVDALNEKLKGKLHITLYMPGQIVPEEEMLDALSKGVYDAAVMGGSWIGARVPEGMVGFGLPMSWQNVDQTFEFYYKFGFLKFVREAFAKQNMYYLAPLPASPLTIMSNFPMRKADDIKGKKLWAPGSQGILTSKLGGVAVTFPPPEMYMALKLGTVDGFIYSLAELETEGYKEVVKYINWPSVVDPLAIAFLTNLDSWKALPPDVQQTIEDTMVQIGPDIFKKYDAANKAGVEAAKKIGVQEITMDPAEVAKVRAAAAEVWKETASKSEGAAKAVQMLKDYLKSKGVEVP